MLKGKKVVLRPIRKSDLELFLKWFNDTEVIKNLVLYLPMTEAAEEKWIQEAMEKQRPIFMIEAILPNGRRKPIGNCGFHQIREKDRVASFGIAIGEKKFWNRGYGTEATRLVIDYGFTWLNLHKIESAAIDFNDRSIKMHLKVGFKKEGRRVESWYRDGKYADSIKFGLLKRWWEKEKRNT